MEGQITLENAYASILKITGEKAQGKKESTEAFERRLLAAISESDDDDDWAKLDESIQLWFNQAVEDIHGDVDVTPLSTYCSKDDEAEDSDQDDEAEDSDQDDEAEDDDQDDEAEDDDQDDEAEDDDQDDDVDVVTAVRPTPPTKSRGRGRKKAAAPSHTWESIHALEGDELDDFANGFADLDHAAFDSIQPHSTDEEYADAICASMNISKPEEQPKSGRGRGRAVAKDDQEQKPKARAKRKVKAKAKAKARTVKKANSKKPGPKRRENTAVHETVRMLLDNPEITVEEGLSKLHAKGFGIKQASFRSYASQIRATFQVLIEDGLVSAETLNQS